jgi:hypothetical protein
MKLTQIATLLNNTLVPNYLGKDVTIAEDLSNVVELGTAIADLDGKRSKTLQATLLSESLETSLKHVTTDATLMDL